MDERVSRVPPELIVDIATTFVAVRRCHRATCSPSTCYVGRAAEAALYPHKSEKLAEDFFIILPRRNIQYSRLHYVAAWTECSSERDGGGRGGVEASKVRRGPALHVNYQRELAT